MLSYIPKKDNHNESAYTAEIPKELEGKPSEITRYLLSKATENKVLIDANLKNADLTGLTFVDVDFTGTDFTNATLGWVTFINCDLCDCVFQEAKLNYSKFKNCCIEDVDFTNASLVHTTIEISSLDRSIFARANLLGARLKNLDFSECDIREAIGNGKEITTIQTGIVDKTIVISETQIAVGCKQFPIEMVWTIEDKVVAEQSKDALDWWHKWKPVVQHIVKKLPT